MHLEYCYLYKKHKVYCYICTSTKLNSVPELDEIDVLADPVHGITELRWHVVTVVAAPEPAAVDGITGLTLHGVTTVTEDVVMGIDTADVITKRRMEIMQRLDIPTMDLVS